MLRVLICKGVHYFMCLYIIWVYYVKSVNMSRSLLFHVFIREYGSTLYVGLARAVSPTNTNFRLTFLLTQLQEALYEDLAV